MKTFHLVIQHKDLIYVDVLFYVIAAVLITALMSINFKKELVIRHIWIMYVTSVIAVLILIAVGTYQIIYFSHDSLLLKSSQRSFN